MSLPIERLGRWLHRRREDERTLCQNPDCRKPIENGPGYCSEQCVKDDLDARF